MQRPGGRWAGPITSACDVLEVRLTSPGGHTARPHLTADLVEAIGLLITQLPLLLTRHVDPRSGTVLVWGAVHAGEAWLEPTMVETRISGKSASSPSAPVTGNHGSAMKEVSVGTNKLEAEPTLNHITGGSNPTFTATVENSGEVEEHNVKVDVTVTAGGKQFKASHTIEKTEPGKTVSVDIPVAGVPLGAAAKIEVFVEGVPGENDLENNKGVFLAIFEK